MRFVPLFLGISGWELAVILLAVLFLFGPGRIPEFARMLGKGLRAFRNIKFEVDKQVRDIERDVNKKIYEEEMKESEKEMLVEKEGLGPVVDYNPDDPYNLEDMRPEGNKK